MKKDIRIAGIGLVVLFTVLTLACAHEGTMLTFDSGATSILRASDQSVMSDAIDTAFDKIDINGMKVNLKEAKAETAYLVIATPFATPQPAMDYLEMKAGLVAGQLGIRVLEVRKIIERTSPERTWEVLQEEFPDTDARILVAVSYLGVDEITTEEQQTTHGSAKPDRVFKGRFKATFGVTPRNSSFSAVVQKIEGESEYEVVRDKFVDAR